MDKYYRQYVETLPIDDTLVIYESHRGVGMICNPYAIFKAFIEHEDFYKYKHVWFIEDDGEKQILIDEYKKYPNVSFVQRTEDDGKLFAMYLATAGYIFQNNTFPYFFTKRNGQLAINTWHCCATVKMLGFDSSNKGFDIGNWNTIRGFYQSDYILSANEFMTEIFRNSYRLQHLYNGIIIQEGQPRNDLTLSTRRHDILEKLKRRGTHADPNKKIILYAPTWREKDVGDSLDCINSYLDIYKALLANTGENTYQILIKPHFKVSKNIPEAAKHKGIFVPPGIDTNELLSVVDILISDYSSIYFDFLQTDRPILFYVPDFEEYTKDRGCYFSFDELPGPYSSNIETICEYIRNIQEISESYKNARSLTGSWACKYDDGKVSRRIVDIVFKNATGRKIINDFYEGEEREKICQKYPS